jgi:hypothetical protein
MESCGKLAKMKRKRPGIRKAKKEPSREQKPRNPPQITGFWGRGGSSWRPGLLLKKHFEEHPESCCADAYYNLSQQLESLNEERVQIGERPIRRPNYSSFSRYFWWFVLGGFLEPIDKYEAAIYPFLRRRHFYRLTSKGRAEVLAWQDPILARHPELR